MKAFVEDYLEVGFNHIPIDIPLLNSLVHFSRLISTHRVEVGSRLISGGYTTTPCNLYAMIFAKSGGYKDVTYKTTEYVIMGGLTTDIKTAYEKNRKEYIEKISEEVNDLGLDRKAKSHYLAIRIPKNYVKEMSKGTFEGFNNLMYSNYVVGVGCTFFRHSEFADILLSKSPDDESLLLSLKEAFDGRVHSKIIKGENLSTDIDKVPTVVLAYSVYDRLIDGDGKVSIDKSFSGGMARRFLVSFIPKKIKPIKKTLEHIELARKIQQDTIAKYNHRFRLMMNSKINWQCSREADERLLQYKNDCAEESYEIVDDSILAEQIEGRFWVALKLAGVIASLENPSDIREGVDPSGRVVKFRELTVEYMETAIYLVQYFGEQFRKFRALKPKGDWEKLFDFFKKNINKNLKRVDIQGGLDMSHHNFKQWFDENIELLDEALVDTEYALIVDNAGKNNKRVYKMVNKSDIPSDTRTAPIEYDLNGFEISCSNNLNDNPWEAKGRTFERAKVSEDTLIDTIKKTAIMPNLLEGGKTAKHVVPGGVLMGIDIDDGMSLLEAKSFFEDNNIRCLIITSASHQQEYKKQTNREITDKVKAKKIKPKDKFHVFAFLNKPWNGTPEQWKAMYKNVVGDIGNVDEACSNINRMFFRSPEDAVVYRLNGHGIDWESYLEGSKPRFKRDAMIVDTSTGINKIKDFTPEQNVDYYTTKVLGMLVILEGKKVVGKNGESIPGRNGYLNNIWKAHFDIGGVSRAEIAVRYANTSYCKPSYEEHEITEMLHNKK